MAICYKDVEQACDAILQEGKSPTILRVREKLTKGSASTIGPLLNKWKDSVPPSPGLTHIEVPQPVLKELTSWLKSHAANARTELDKRLADAAQDQDTLTRALSTLETELEECKTQLTAMTTERDQEAAIALEKKLEVNRLLKELERERNSLNAARSELGAAQFQITNQAERLTEIRTQLETSERTSASMRDAKSDADVRAAVAIAERQTLHKVAEERSQALTDLEHRYRECQDRITSLRESHADQLAVERDQCMRLEDEVMRIKAEARNFSGNANHSQSNERIKAS